MKKMILCFGSLVLSVAAMAGQSNSEESPLASPSVSVASAAMAANSAAEKYTTVGKNELDAVASICAMSIKVTVMCADGTQMIAGSGTIAFWCDSGTVIGHLSHFSSVSASEACASHSFLEA